MKLGFLWPVPSLQSLPVPSSTPHRNKTPSKLLKPRFGWKDVQEMIPRWMLNWNKCPENALENIIINELSRPNIQIICLENITIRYWALNVWIIVLLLNTCGLFLILSSLHHANKRCAPTTRDVKKHGPMAAFVWPNIIKAYEWIWMKCCIWHTCMLGIDKYRSEHIAPQR